MKRYPEKNCFRKETNWTIQRI